MVSTLAFVLALSAPPAPSHCFAYAPAVVTLEGVVTRKTFPGPPNYESLAGGDAPMTYWILALDRPACVDATPGDDTETAESGVRRVQLILNESQYRTYGALLGKRVRVAGTLTHQATGHHVEVLLLTVRDLAPATRPSR